MTIGSPDQPIDVLVRQFQRDRTEAAFRNIYRAYGDRVFRLCARLLAGSSESPDDAAQESWLRAVRSINKFEGRSSFSTWVCGIAVNVVHEMIRHENRAEFMDIDLSNFGSELDDKSITNSQGLGAAVDLLPSGYRTVVILHDVEGFTHDEIAKVLNISAGTSKSQLSRARAKLREILSDEMVDKKGTLS